MLDGASWEADKFPRLTTKRPDLLPALIAACHRQCAQGVRTVAWTRSCLLAIRLSKETHSDKDSINELRRALADLPSDAREDALWAEDAFLQSLHRSKDIWGRVFDLCHHGGIQLVAEKDETWVRKRLSDPNEPLDHREMMLWIEMTALLRRRTNTAGSLESLKKFVVDAPSLMAIIDNRLKPSSDDAEMRRLQARNDKITKQSEQRTAKAHASRVQFWREIERDPDAVFAPDRADNTAWNLWQAMERSGHESRASGWNRRFIEEQFGKEVADRLRTALSAMWRKDEPTLRSERPDPAKNTFLVRWQLGLAAIAAEAEDPSWAKALTEAEAELACRYAPMELNGFPSWLESLVAAHPAAVDRVLGQELSLSLREPSDANAYPIFLQNVSHASPKVAALFIPRIREWLTEAAAVMRNQRSRGRRRLSQAVEVLMKNGSEDDRQFLESVATQRLAGGLMVPFAELGAGPYSIQSCRRNRDARKRIEE